MAAAFTGTSVTPSTTTGSSSVAAYSLYRSAFLESMGSIVRTAISVPVGSVMPCGAVSAGGGGAEGGVAEGAAAGGGVAGRGAAEGVGEVDADAVDGGAGPSTGSNWIDKI